MAKWQGERSWEQQPKESRQAYEAFSLYLKLGNERSLRRVEQELHKSHALIGRWSRDWSWQKRSRDYDAELRRFEFEEKKKEVKKMQQRQIRTATLLQKKAVEALQNLDISTLSPKDILRFITEGAKIEREIQNDSVLVLESETSEGRGESLADTIVSAYRQRMEGGTNGE